jgi:hypothetical protein
MNRQEQGTVGRCHERTLSKVMIAVAVVAFAWLSACPEKSQAQRMRVTQRIGGPVAEKPLPPPRVNAPMIIDVSETKEGYVDIRIQNFAADVSKIALERQLVTKKGDGAWFVVFSRNIHDHREGHAIDPHVHDNQRRPGAVYVYHESAGLTPGDQYRYRVRAIQPYKPRPVVLLSAVKTITVKPLEVPTPPVPTPPVPTSPSVVSKTIHLQAKPIGQFLRPYLAISLIPGNITQIEIPEVNGQTLQVSFVKRGYKMTETLNNPDATVMLTSGQTSTPSQITELFGTAQKKLHVKFVAFVAASQGKEPNSVAIKISYDKTK